jgi:hypothetical protein
MAAEDELALPTVPEAKPEDPEDVSWALSTAEAMWARGDNLEGIKWVRKAAEAAADAEQDERYLELVKAASELASLIARRSQASIAEGPGYAGGAPPDQPLPMPPTMGAPMSSHPVSSHPGSSPPVSSHLGNMGPSTERSGSATVAVAVPSRPPPVPPKSAPPPVGRSGAPGPIPLPSRASQAPKAPQAPPRAAPRPLATSDARQGPQAGRGILSNRTAPEASSGKSPKARRRSRENLDVEARAAGVLDTAPHAAVDSDTAARALRNDVGEVTAVGVDPRMLSGGGNAGSGGAVERSAAANATTKMRRRSRPEPDPTVVGSIDDLVAAERGERERSAAEWDASPTQNLTGDELADRMNDGGDRVSEGDRQTAFQVQAVLPAATSSVAPPAPRAPQSTVHDPEIQTSQAVRVVVWRDGNGVHIAPAGTVVSSITIDAVLVVLEPTADLTAWLSQRER